MELTTKQKPQGRQKAVALYSQKWKLTQAETLENIKKVEAKAFKPIPESSLERNITFITSEEEADLSAILAQDLDRHAQASQEYILNGIKAMKSQLKSSPENDWGMMFDLYSSELQDVDSRDFNRTVKKFLIGEVGNGWFPVFAEFNQELKNERKHRKNASQRLKYSVRAFDTEYALYGKYNRFDGV